MSKKLYVDLSAFKENAARLSAGRENPKLVPSFFLFDASGAAIGSGRSVVIAGATSQDVSINAIPGGLRAGADVPRHIEGAEFVITLADDAVVTFDA